LQPGEPEQIDFHSSVLHIHTPPVNNLINVDFRKNFAIVRTRQGRERKARKTRQRKKWTKRKHEKKKKVEASKKAVEKVTRLDINLTDPLPTYEELLLEIFHTGSRQGENKRKRMNGFSAVTTTTPHTNQLTAVQEPPPIIQPYEYPLKFTFDDGPKSLATSIPTGFNTPPYFTPVNAKSAAKKKKSSKKSELGKRQKSFTRRLKEHKPSRPTPTPFEQLDI